MKSNVQNPDEAARIVRSRVRLLLDHPWFGQLALNLRVVEDQTIKAMRTDGTRLAYNPDWTATQSDEVVVGTIAHEAMHCGLRHVFRTHGRDLATWNQACDYAINPLLTASNLQLPEGALVDPSYANLPAETIYAKLIQKQDEQRQKEQDERQEREKSNQQSDTPYDDDQDESDDRSDADQDSDETNDPDDDADSDRDDGEPDPNGTPQEDADDGSNDIVPPTDSDGDGVPDDDGIPTMSEIDWQIVADQAGMVAKKRGLMPADAERAFDETLEPRVDWRTELARFVEQTMPSDYSWSQPNRRYIATGLYLPSVVKENTARLVVAIDTSGSVDQRTLAAFGTEITAIMRETRPSSIDVVSCDARIQNVETFTPDDQDIVLHARGGGGTAFQPLFDWVADQPEPPAAIIYLTDLQGDEPTDPDIPTLWVTPEHVTEIGRFGETIRIPATIR